MTQQRKMVNQTLLLLYRIFSRITTEWHLLFDNDKLKNQKKSLKNYITHNWSMIADDTINNSLLVYSSAIGEFNALRPFIDHYRRNKPETKLVILAGDPQYLTPYHKAYPDAIVGLLMPPNPALYDKLFQKIKPSHTVIAEGPSLYCHFPLKMDLALPAMCMKHNVPLAILNATPWPLCFPSRIFRIEYILFRNIFKEAVIAWFTPYTQFQEQLISYGVPANRIYIVGDMKYDVAYKSTIPPTNEELTHLLTKFQGQDNKPLIVAGSVSDPQEQKEVIKGWQEVRKKWPGAKLVIAPRQIKHTKAMLPLLDYLETNNVQFSRRSEGNKTCHEANLLILDVYGELLHFYSISTLCYIGLNHGVLEPMQFEKPTIVGPAAQWDHNRPTYWMYRQLVKSGGIRELNNISELGTTLIKLLQNNAESTQMTKNATHAIQKNRGAAKHTYEILTDLTHS